MDQKRVTSWVIKVLAVLGGLGLVAALIGGIVLALAVSRGFSARESPSAVEALIARTMRSWSTPSGAKNLRSPIKTSPETLAEARAHWADHCAICHANNGSGDTQIGKGLYPKAPDMRTKPTQQLSDGELYYIIENGVRLTGMPAWGHGGTESEESWNLVAFIRHLPSLTPEEERQMERMNPKSVEERQREEEEKEEDDFLRGVGGQAPGAKHGHDKHEH
jgi:mono/diheme cytochrome c family protein